MCRERGWHVALLTGALVPAYADAKVAIQEIETAFCPRAPPPAVAIPQERNSR
jgi:hypothetical protein